MIRFDVGGALTAATPVIYDLFSAADNPTYATVDGPQPTLHDHWLDGLNVSSDGGMKVEIGLCTAAKANFTPLYTVYLVAAGSTGRHKRFVNSRPKVTFTDPTLNRLAVRLTATATGTFYAAGDVDTVQGF